MVHFIEQLKAGSTGIGREGWGEVGSEGKKRFFLFFLRLSSVGDQYHG